MTPEQARVAIKAVARSNFDLAAAAFGERPTGDNWGSLMEAMWAYQATTSEDTMEKAMKVLPNLAVGMWTKELRIIHEGKAS